jgi:hypothetical protein
MATADDTTQARFEAYNTNENNPTTELLEDPEGVAALSDEEVKDVWARGEFMYQIIRANGPEFMHQQGDLCDKIEHLLAEGNPGAIYEASLRGLNRTHSTTQLLADHDADELVDVLFDHLTVDDPEDVLIEWARGKIDSALGGCGMPRINVFRARMSYHNDTEA